MQELMIHPKYSKEKDFKKSGLVLNSPSLEKGLYVFGDNGVGKTYLFEILHKMGYELTKYGCYDLWFGMISAVSFVEKYMKENNLSDRLDGYHWEFNLVEDSLINAWAMPGGKVVVYTGILAITQNDTGLAVVLGHEIAHAIAEHGNERMSQELLRQAGAISLMAAMNKEPSQTKALWLGIYGVGTQVAMMLPYSRTHESEADRLGLTFMAMAGYNPHAAPEFWQRMSASKEGGAPPEFLSTHPSDETRIKDLKSWIPEAMKYFKK